MPVFSLPQVGTVLAYGRYTPHAGRIDAGPPELRVRRRIGWTDGTFLMRIAMESLMRSKQTATDARRRLASPRYVVLLLLAAFSLSACGGVPDMQATLVVGGAKKNYYDLLSSVQSELASPTPDLMKIGVSLDEMEAYRESIIKVLNQFDVASKDYNEFTDQADPKGVMEDQIAALTDQFD